MSGWLAASSFAQSGTVYRIAVDGVKEPGQSVAFGNVVLTLESAPLMFDPVDEFVPLGGDWAYLLYTEAMPADISVDPGVVDQDFYSTWFQTTGYDGPLFLGPAAAPLGYGTIDAESIVTDIWAGRDYTGDGNGDPLPAPGLRHATFFRTSFTPAEFVENLGFEGVVDDGAIIYVNGSEVARMNIDPNQVVTNWAVSAFDEFVLGEPTEAIASLRLAADRGYYVKSELVRNTDLDLLRGLPEFQELM